MGISPYTIGKTKYSSEQVKGTLRHSDPAEINGTGVARQ